MQLQLGFLSTLNLQVRRPRQNLQVAKFDSTKVAGTPNSSWSLRDTWKYFLLYPEGSMSLHNIDLGPRATTWEPPKYILYRVMDPLGIVFGHLKQQKLQLLLGFKV